MRIMDRDEEYNDLYDETFPAADTPPTDKPDEPPQEATGQTRTYFGRSGTLSDMEVLALAFRAANGAQIKALYNGSDLHFASKSDADASLITRFIFYTESSVGGGISQLIRLMRGSGRNREKWNDRRSDQNFLTYDCQRLIDNYRNKRGKVYEPPGITVTLGSRHKTGRNGATDEEDGPEETEQEESGPSAGAEEDEPSVIHETDLGNARRFICQHGRDLRYVYELKEWMYWDGKRWTLDRRGEVRRRAHQTVASIYREAALATDLEERTRLAKWAMKSESDRAIAAMVKIAQDLDGVTIVAEELDASPWLCNCQNGTLDLRTGEMRPHRREDLLTKICPVDYDPAAECPLWDAFLARVLPDAEVRAFVQRAAGKSLSGDAAEHIIVFAWGKGKNGKSTAVNALRDVYGDYGGVCRADVLMVDRNGPNRGATPDIADLKGLRFVSVTELEDGQRFNEALIKSLTGGDQIKGRPLYARSIEFAPTHTLWLAGNHKPTISGNDEGIWRRVKLIPFTVQIPDEETDISLPIKLKAERSGILAWLVRGCQEWQQNGLQEPEEVKAATKTYRRDMDTIGNFITEMCVVDPTTDVYAKEIYAAYKLWCDENGERTMKQRTFGMKLTEHGFESDHKETGNIRLGIRLKTADEKLKEETAAEDARKKRAEDARKQANPEATEASEPFSGKSPTREKYKESFTEKPFNASGTSSPSQNSPHCEGSEAETASNGDGEPPVWTPDGPKILINASALTDHLLVKFDREIRAVLEGRIPAPLAAQIMNAVNTWWAFAERQRGSGDLKLDEARTHKAALYAAQEAFQAWEQASGTPADGFDEYEEVL